MSREPAIAALSSRVGNEGCYSSSPSVRCLTDTRVYAGAASGAIVASWPSNRLGP